MAGIVFSVSYYIGMTFKTPRFGILTLLTQFYNLSMQDSTAAAHKGHLIDEHCRGNFVTAVLFLWW